MRDKHPGWRRQLPCCWAWTRLPRQGYQGAKVGKKSPPDCALPSGRHTTNFRMEKFAVAFLLLTILQTAGVKLTDEWKEEQTLLCTQNFSPLEHSEKRTVFLPHKTLGPFPPAPTAAPTPCLFCFLPFRQEGGLTNGFQSCVCSWQLECSWVAYSSSGDSRWWNIFHNLCAHYRPLSDWEWNQCWN